MAEDKKSFIAYSDWNETFKKLTDDEAGKLSKMIFSFVADENPIPPDRITELLFEPIKQHLKRDLKKYEEIKVDRSLSGRMGNLKRYNLDIYIKVEAQEITLEEGENLAKSRKASHSEKNLAKLAVNDNDNDNVNGNEKEITTYTPTAFSMFSSLLDLGAEKQLVNDWLKVRKTKKATNTETAFNGFKSQLEKSKKDINEILKLCIEKSWAGFNTEWAKDLKETQEDDRGYLPNETKEQRDRRLYIARAKKQQMSY